MAGDESMPETVAEYAIATMRPLFDAIRELERRVRAGNDPEAVHDMRVGSRRLRGALSTFEDVLPPGFQGLGDELTWTGACLGGVRDLDVQIETLGRVRDTASGERAEALRTLISRLARSRDAAQERLVDALMSERYAALIARMSTALAAHLGDSGVPVREYAPDVIRRRYRKLRKAAKSLDTHSPAPEFHRARIKAKHLRYTVEVFEAVYGKAATELAAEATTVQDVLGEHQDLIVLNQRLESMVREEPVLPPWALVTAGELMEHNRQKAALIRESWDGIGGVRRACRRLRRVL